MTDRTNLTPETVAQHLVADWQYMMSDGSIAWENNTAIPELQSIIDGAVAAERDAWQSAVTRLEDAYKARIVELEAIVASNKTPCPEHGFKKSICAVCIDEIMNA